MISFIIPAHNEEALLGLTLASIHAAAAHLSQPYEVIVVDDASTDSTARIAEEAGAKVIAVGFRQIAATRNAGAKVASGEILVFVDADTQISSPVLAAVLAALASGAVGGSGLFRFDHPVPRWGRILYAFIMPAARLLQVTGGCFMFCTREAFDAVGGFPEEFYAGEDLGMLRRLKRHGRYVIPRPLVLTSGRKLSGEGGRQILSLVGNVLRHGPRYLTVRENLDIWYGPRESETGGWEGPRS